MFMDFYVSHVIKFLKKKFSPPRAFDVDFVFKGKGVLTKNCENFALQPNVP